MSAPSNKSPERVPVEIIRQFFNENQYYERMLMGEFIGRCVKESIVLKPPGHMLAGTKSQSVWYYDKNYQLIAKVHQYVRVDGSLAGSGKPDPKWLNHNGRIMAPIFNINPEVES